MVWALTVAVTLTSLLIGCAPPPPAFVTPIPSTPRSIATLSADRTVSVAVAVGSATPTPQLVGDYPTLVRPRLDRVQQGLSRIEQQLNILNTNPIRMAEADWRNQLQSLLEDLASANTDLRSLGARSGPDASLYADVMKLNGELDFVVSEYRMALDFDADGTHFIRAGRAEKMAADEVESMLLGLRRTAALTLTPRPR